jgi:hypothetical protein
MYARILSTGPRIKPPNLLTYLANARTRDSSYFLRFTPADQLCHDRLTPEPPSNYRSGSSSLHPRTQPFISLTSTLALRKNQASQTGALDPPPFPPQ